MMMWIWIAGAVFLLGKGLLGAVYRKRVSPDIGWTDAFPTGICVEIGLIETAHLAAVFFGCSLKRAVILWAALNLLLCTASFLYLVTGRLISYRKERSWKRSGLWKHGWTWHTGEWSVSQRFLAVTLVLSVILQAVLLWTRQGIRLEGDMTLETVRSFLDADAVYQINPLTGRAYEAGIPLRIRILSLPTLYASLCLLFHMEPVTVVWGCVPIVVLLVSYCVYYLLGKLLFGDNRTRLLFFLLAVNMIFWLGDYMEEMDAFQLMHAGFRGTAIRAGILIPYTFYACLRGRFWQAALCALAEACIVWTFYGMGACLFVTVLMVSLQAAGRIWKRRREKRCGNS